MCHRRHVYCRMINFLFNFNLLDWLITELTITDRNIMVNWLMVMCHKLVKSVTVLFNRKFRLWLKNQGLTDRTDRCTPLLDNSVNLGLMKFDMFDNWFKCRLLSDTLFGQNVTCSIPYTTNTKIDKVT